MVTVEDCQTPDSRFEGLLAGDSQAVDGKAGIPLSVKISNLLQSDCSHAAYSILKWLQSDGSTELPESSGRGWVDSLNLSEQQTTSIHLRRKKSADKKMMSKYPSSD